MRVVVGYLERKVLYCLLYMQNRAHPRHYRSGYVRGYLHRQADVYSLPGRLLPLGTVYLLFFNTGSQVRFMPSFLKILRSTSLSITVQ